MLSMYQLVVYFCVSAVCSCVLDFVVFLFSVFLNEIRSNKKKIKMLNQWCKTLKGLFGTCV